MKIHISITDDNGNHYVGDADLLKTKSGNSSLSKPTIMKKGTKPKAPQIIRKLYSENFFKVQKKQQDIMKKLESMGFNFDESMVRMALLRADFLNKKQINHVNFYIQKYPAS